MENELTFYKRKDGLTFYSFYPDIGKRATGSIGKQKPEYLKSLVTKHIGHCRLADTPVTHEDIKALLDEAVKGVKRETLTVSLMIDSYIKDIQEGKIKTHRGNNFSSNTIRMFESVRDVIIARSPKFGGLQVAKLDKQDIQKFQSDLINAGLAKNSVATYNNNFISILVGAYRNGVHKNNLHKSESLSYTPEEVDYHVYYSIRDLQILYNKKYKNEWHEKARDIFIFGCFTCMRHSDYYKTNYKEAYLKEKNVLTFKTQKNKSPIYMELHPIAREILHKYDYQLPKYTREWLSAKMREAVKMAGFTENCLFTRTQRGATMHGYKEKWELTSTHTMRRSFATNAVLNGMPEKAIMAIGGWKTEKSFRRYIRLNNQELATLASGSEFYRVVLG